MENKIIDVYSPLNSLQTQIFYKIYYLCLLNYTRLNFYYLTILLFYWKLYFAQKVRQEVMKNRKTEIIYNKRKLGEFVNFIKMLQSDKQKVELLKEYIYFNEDFMTSKAE